MCVNSYENLLKIHQNQVYSRFLKTVYISKNIGTRSNILNCGRTDAVLCGQADAWATLAGNETFPGLLPGRPDSQQLLDQAPAAQRSGEGIT